MRNVIITGSSSGIGMATAKELDTGAYRMIIAGRNEDKLRQLSESLSCEHIVHVGDVREYSDCQRMVQTSLESWGGVDVLVNNAGLGYFDPLETGKIEEWHNMVDINIKGVLNCLHAALPTLKVRDGHVINLGSVASHQVFPDSGIYCATKHALLAISKSIHLELKGRVKVTTISPGQVDTDFVNKTTNDEIRTKMKDYFASGLRPSDIAAQIRHAIEAPKGVVINEIIVRPFK
jgi:NADP-dependent 3-hydroxy acid dehydrogenase YdfG